MPDVTVEVPEEFVALAERLGATVPELLRDAIHHILKMDGVVGIEKLDSDDGSIAATTEVIATAMLQGTANILPGANTWPEDHPFPWTDSECAAIVRGYKVKWRGSKEDFRNLLPGRYEREKGYAYLR